MVRKSEIIGVIRYGSAKESAWTALFHKSSNVGFEHTSDILIRLLDKNQEFSNEILKKIADDYLQECETKSIYPLRYYYIKYAEYRPRSYGKMHNSAAEKNQYMFSVMQTKTYLSQNTYVPFLKIASDAHL